MRKYVASCVSIVVVVVIAWIAWPATSWPSTFCNPVVRVVGKDADAVTIYVSKHHFNYNQLVKTTTPASMYDALLGDVTVATRQAPTEQLRRELTHYAFELNTSPTLNQTTDAMGHFDESVRTQLRACGITPG
ncbi:MAG: hypothetical protein ACRDVC_11240 [Acidimicrobiales bacterium]